MNEYCTTTIYGARARALRPKIALLCFKDHSESASFHPAVQQAMSVSDGASSGTTLYRQLMMGSIAVCNIHRTVRVCCQPTLGTFLGNV